DVPDDVTIDERAMRMFTGAAFEPLLDVRERAVEVHSHAHDRDGDGREVIGHETRPPQREESAERDEQQEREVHRNDCDCQHFHWSTPGSAPLRSLCCRLTRQIMERKYSARGRYDPPPWNFVSSAPDWVVPERTRCSSHWRSCSTRPATT